LRVSACKIANLARLLQLFISRNMALQREKVYFKRIIKDIIASLDI
jgi:hypothetical protein